MVVSGSSGSGRGGGGGGGGDDAGAPFFSGRDSGGSLESTGVRMALSCSWSPSQLTPRAVLVSASGPSDALVAPLDHWAQALLCLLEFMV